jgi:cation diffusion facilitator family transporter
MNHNHSHEKQNVALLSLLASGGLSIVKFAAALASGSLGLLSEAFHSLMDFGATALTLLAVRVSDKPADDEHHYGHAKAENVVALIECGMLFGIAAWVTYEAVLRLINGGHEVELSWWLFAIVIASIAIDFNRSRALKKTAEKTASAALAADALHFAADMWSSFAVLIGLTLVWLGYGFADSAAALIVAVFVAHAAWDLGKHTLNNLLDAAPAGTTDLISTAVGAVNGVLGIRQLRVRPAGSTLYVDLTVDVPRTLPSAQLAALRRDIQSRVTTAFDKVALIAEQHDLKVHHLVVQTLEGRMAVSFDVEVDAAIPLSLAHEKATALENDIRGGLGSDIEVESHIEPLEPRLLAGEPPPAAVTRKIETTLEKFAAREKSLSDLHNIRVRTNAAGIYVHYHCRFAPQMTIADVHEVTDRMEIALMGNVSGIKRVIAHAEPVGYEKHWL